MLKQPDNIIHLASAFDANFLTPFYVSLTSVFHNNRGCTFHIHTIATGIGEEEKEKLIHYVRLQGSDIFFYEIDEAYVQSFAVLPAHWNITIATYYRLFFPSLVSDKAKKLLYLDTDIIVTGKLAALYNKNIGPSPVAAASDTAISYSEHLGILEKGAYFNAGVLLINTEEWNRQHITEKAIRFIKDFPDKIKIVEQDALNAILVNNWARIDSRYNIMYADIPTGLTKRKRASFLKRIVIVHYTTTNKPWLVSGNNKLRFLYHHYLKKSPCAGKKKYIDFRWEKNTIKQLMKIRLTETYFSFPALVQLWRKAKYYLKQEVEIS